MRQVWGHRPSGSILVAIVALVVALSGTAVAASSLVNGDKLIKKDSLSGNRLRSHTVTGRQINLGKLGKVPTAGHADSATDASNLGGSPASAYARTSILRFLRINADGSVDSSRSTTSAAVTHPAAGSYCVDGLSPAPRSVLVSGAFGLSTAQVYTYAEVDPSSEPCKGHQIGVATYAGSTPTPTDEPFYLAIGS